jgi:hypothetical protein
MIFDLVIEVLKNNKFQRRRKFAWHDRQIFYLPIMEGYQELLCSHVGLKSH